MARAPVTGLLSQYAKNAGGAAAAGYWLKFYTVNTTTQKSIFTAITAGSTLSKCTLNSRGEPISNQADDDSTFIPYVDGDYDAYLYETEADADANNTIAAVFLGRHETLPESLSDVALLQFATVNALISKTSLNYSETIDWADYLGRKVAAIVNNTTSNDGGAEYVITNVNPGNLSTLVGGIWVGANHDLGGGFYAKRLNETEKRALTSVGGVASGSTDNTAAIASSFSANNRCDVDAGAFGVDGLVISGDAARLSGAGMRNSAMQVLSTSPTYGVTLTGDYQRVDNLRITGTGGVSNLMSFSGDTYYAQVNNVWFSDAAIGFKNVDGNDFFYSGFLASHWRDCAIGVQATSQDDFNGTYFLGCTFNYPNSALVGPSLDLAKSDGISYIGCTTQNQTIKLDDVQGFEICGGYHETGNAQTNPILESKNSIFNISGGTHFPPGAYFKIDSYAGRFSKGNLPNCYSKETEGITRQDNDSQFLAPTQESVDNLFPDTACSTTTAVANIQFTSTGNLPAAAAINGSSNVELGFTATDQRGGFEVPGVANISFFMKWRALTGTVRVGLGNTTVTQNTDHDSTTDSEWRYTWLHGRTLSGSPYVNIQPLTATASIEIDEFSCVANYCFVRAGGSQFKWPKGTATLAAGTAAVTFTRVPGGADYQITLSGNTTAETFAWATKTRTGFTINSSNVASVAQVDWSIVSR